MAGVVVNEGETLIGQVIFQRTHVDRDATLKLGLFTNSSGLGETTALGDITPPTGGSYAAITLTDASWDVTAGVASYAQQTFTATGSAYSAAIYGYYIFTVSSGGTARLLAYEVDAAGPHTMNENDTYKVTPSITIS